MSKATKAAETCRIYSIPPGAPFLETLAGELVAGRLVPGFVPADDPLCLADATIYLPTRRAARKLSLEILNAMRAATGNSASILPSIRTLGDLDEEEILSGLAGSTGSEVPLDLGKVTPHHERLLQLARLAMAWTESLKPETRDLFRSEPVILPSSASDAIRLAASLARFMDQVETEETAWTALAGIVPDDQPWSKWWQLTLAFLQIVMEHWPRYLEARGEIGPAEFRRRLVGHRAAIIDEGKIKGPVIAAGSTGSIPATARLLATIARSPMGAVVLPGFDHHLPESAWKILSASPEFEGESSVSTHPQFGLVRLVNGIAGFEGKSGVIDLGGVPSALGLRERAINLALLPSTESSQWRTHRQSFNEESLREAFSGVGLIEAAEEAEEARAIALCLRQVLESPGKTSALVTPDRNLARRVASELMRYGIAIDDSAGIALSTTASAGFLISLLQFVMEPGDAVTAAALLKSPFCLAGFPAGTARNRCELLELAIFRGRVKQPEPHDLANAVRERQLEIANDPFVPAALKILTESDWDELAEFAGAISACIKPVCELAAARSFSVPGFMAALATCAARLSSDDTGMTELGTSPGGRELTALFDEFARLDSGTEPSGFALGCHDAVPVFHALVEELRVRDGTRTHPRLNIYGPLEARLQTPDLVVLGGLNEGSWPNVSAGDQFLNRPMRSSLGLPLPERRAGLAAHDFAQLSGIGEVVYSRSQRSDNAPSVASRWLQRLEVFLGKDLMNGIRARGNAFIGIANAMDAPRSAPPVPKAPEPRPAVELRPKKLSITEIETWIRDPYAIYARHVLGLRALPPLVRNADAALRGSIHHDIVAEFISDWRGEIDEHAAEHLRDIANRHFHNAELPADIAAVWLPRFDAIATPFLEWERNRSANVSSSACETSARMEIGSTGFSLKGRADRIDVMKDGSLAIIDYKSGVSPSAEQARTLAPQLALEGALARAGKFHNVPAGRLQRLSYVRLREGDGFREDDISLKNGKVDRSAEELADAAIEQLAGHIQAYSNPGQPYVSRFAVQHETEAGGEYDHLARVREWSLGGADAGEDGA